MVARDQMPRHHWVMTQKPKLRDLNPVTARTMDFDAPFAERRYEYLIAKRDQVQDRIRTGALALNGSSLVAMIAVMSAEGKAAEWIGLTAGNARLSASAFALGVMAAGAAIFAVNALFTDEAAAAFTRYMRTRQVAASYEAPNEPQSWQDSTDALARYAESPLVDFRYSKVSIISQNISAACWAVGIAIPLLNSFGFS